MGCFSDIAELLVYIEFKRYRSLNFLIEIMGLGGHSQAEPALALLSFWLKRELKCTGF